MSYDNLLGQKLRATRFLLKLSLKAAGEQMKVAAATLFRIEMGGRVNYHTGKSIEVWLKNKKIAICLGCNGLGYFQKEDQIAEANKVLSQLDLEGRNELST